MSRPRRNTLSALAFAGVIAAAATAAGQAGDAAPPPARAAVVELEGEIDRLTERTLEMQIARALEDSPRFLVLSIDSPGGLVEASRTIAWNLHRLEEVTTVAFVRGRALSGATMVAFGCDVVAMAPEGQLGDVLPITVQLGGLAPEVAEKFIRPVRKDLEDLAGLQGYPRDAAAAMVDPRVELHRVEVRDEDGRIRPRWLTAERLAELPWAEREAILADEVVCRAGELLVVGALEAQDMGIAHLLAEDADELCRRLAHEYSLAEVVPVEIAPLWWSHVVRFITWWPVKVLLFVLGLVALLAAFASPGLGVPEGVAVAAFAAVFFGSYLIGLADAIEVVLFAIGVILVAVELFTPSFGILGGSGLALIALSLLLSFQTFVIPETPAEWVLFQRNVGRTAMAGVVSLVALAVAARFLPKTRLLRRLVHDHALATGAGAAADAPAGGAVPVGTSATAATVLRPSGKVRVGDDLLAAVAESGYVPAGAAVVVVGQRSGELVVAPLPEAQAAPQPSERGEEEAA